MNAKFEKRLDALEKAIGADAAGQMDAGYLMTFERRGNWIEIASVETIGEGEAVTLAGDVPRDANGKFDASELSDAALRMLLDLAADPDPGSRINNQGGNNHE